MVYKPDYVMWLKHNHPEAATLLPPSSLSSSSSSTGHSDSNTSVTHYSKSTESSKILDDLLVYPKATDAKTKGKKKKAINSGKAVVITDSEIPNQLKQEKTEKEAKALEKETKALEKQAKVQEKEWKKKIKELE